MAARIACSHCLIAPPARTAFSHCLLRPAGYTAAHVDLVWLRRFRLGRGADGLAALRVALLCFAGLDLGARFRSTAASAGQPAGQIPTLQFEDGSVMTLDLLAAVVSRWSGTRAHLAAHRPDLLGVLLHVEQHPDLAPVFARHWPS